MMEERFLPLVEMRRAREKQRQDFSPDKSGSKRLNERNNKAREKSEC